MWWPKVVPPKGWHYDEGSSRHFAFNAIAPDGSTFFKAETVMYGKADYKPRMPKTKDLSSLISGDIANFKSSDSTLASTREALIRSFDGIDFQVVAYSPSKGSSSQWERVAYGEDGDYYITFVVSSRTKSGLKGALAAFKALVQGYRSGP